MLQTLDVGGERQMVSESVCGANYARVPGRVVGGESNEDACCLVTLGAFAVVAFACGVGVFRDTTCANVGAVAV